MSTNFDWCKKSFIEEQISFKTLLGFKLCSFWSTERFFLPPGIGKIMTMISFELSELEMVLLEVWEMLFNEMSLLLLLLLLMLLLTLVIALKVKIMKVKKLKLLKPRLPILLSTWPDEHPISELLFLLYLCWENSSFVLYKEWIVWLRLLSSKPRRLFRLFEPVTEK